MCCGGKNKICMWDPLHFANSRLLSHIGYYYSGLYYITKLHPQIRKIDWAVDKNMGVRYYLSHSVLLTFFIMDNAILANHHFRSTRSFKFSVNRQTGNVPVWCSPRYLITYNRVIYINVMARNALGGPGRLQNKNARTAFTARHKLAVVASFDELGTCLRLFVSSTRIWLAADLTVEGS